MKKLILITLLILVTACSPKNESAADFENSELDCVSDSSVSGIVKGRNVASHEAISKNVVLILIRRDQKVSSCTGVPIAKNVILTAAHCVAYTKESDVHVVFDTSMLCTAGYTREKAISARAMLIHDDFNGSPASHADLALIQLSKNIPNDYIVSKLFNDDIKNISSDVIELSGYGITHENNKDSMILRTTQKSLKQDTEVKGPLLLINQKNSTGGFCRGDSGAPVFGSNQGDKKVIGINSYNIEDQDNKSECHTASVVMYIPVFVPWIETQLRMF